MNSSTGNPAHPRGASIASGSNGNASTMTGRSPYHPANSSRRRSSGAGVGGANANTSTAAAGRTSAVAASRMMMSDTSLSHMSSASSSFLSMSGNVATRHKLPSLNAFEATKHGNFLPLHDDSSDGGYKNQSHHESNIPGQLRALAASSLAHCNSFSTFNAVLYGELLYNATHSHADAVLCAHALYTNCEYKRCAIFLERVVGLVPTPSSPLFTLLETDLQYRQQHHGDRNNISPHLVLQATMLASLSYMQLMEYEEAQSLVAYTTTYLIRSITGIDDSSCKKMLLNEFPFVADEEDEQPMVQQHRQQHNHGKIRTKKSLHPDLIQISAIIQRHSDIAVFGNAVGTIINPTAQFCTLRGRIYDALGNSKKASIWLQAALHIDVFCMEAFHLLMDRNLLSAQEQWALIDSLQFDAVWIEDDTNIGNPGVIGGGKAWLRDLMISHFYCSSSNGGNHKIKHQEMDKDATQDKYGAGASSLHNMTSFSMNQTNISQHAVSTNVFMEMLSPGSSIKDISAIHPEYTPATGPANYAEQNKSVKFHSGNKVDDINDIDQAFIRLTTTHSGGTQDASSKSNNEIVGRQHEEDIVGIVELAPFQRSTIILASAARRALTCHALHLAASFCAAIYALDPLCPYVIYTHMATLVGLKRKRELFYLAHQLVQANPKAASSWFAVGCYYHVCGRYDVGQRHFCRATRLEPKCTEAWIAFGNSFAMADESDQALAAYRAAQRCDSGNTHVPFLHMGMEYLRTSHLTLARHFFECAMNKNPDDPLPASELAVCAYKQGRYEEAIAWSLEAMNKQAELEQRMNFLCQAHSVLSEEISVTATFSQRSHPSTNTFKVEGPLSCVISCRDPFWEPTISNLGHSYRKLRSYEEALICYEVALRLCPSSSSNYTSLGFTKQFQGDLDGAIDLYHKALSIKPDDSLAGEMLTRALHESLSGPEITASGTEEEISGVPRMGQNLTSGVHHSLGSSILSGQTGRAPLLFGSMNRQSHSQQRSTVGSTNDSSISFATGSSDMETRIS